MENRSNREKIEEKIAKTADKLNHMSTSSKPRPSKIDIPLMRTPAYKYKIGVLDSDMTTIEHVINLDKHETVALATFEQIHQLCSVLLPMKSDEFVRVWKTLVLLRTFDSYEHATGCDLASRPECDTNVLVPAPLHDLLKALGRFESDSGLIHDVSPGKPPEELPDYWTYDAKLMNLWSLTMGRIRLIYDVREYPVPTDYFGLPLQLVKLKDTDKKRTVKSWSHETTPECTILTVIHEELFGAHEYITFDNCALTLCVAVRREQLVAEYVGSYTLGSNS